MTLKQLAQEVLDLIDAGEYRVDETVVRFAEQQNRAVQSTRLYRPDELESLRAEPAKVRQVVHVVDGTTQVVAQQLSGAGELALLNFASARNPGGGFERCKSTGRRPVSMQWFVSLFDRTHGILRSKSKSIVAVVHRSCHLQSQGSVLSNQGHRRSARGSFLRVRDHSTGSE